MTGALSAHSARALADSVFRPNSGLSPEDAVTELADVEAMVSGSKDLRLVLLSPAVNRSRKVALITKLAEQMGLHRIVRNFLLVVVTHRRTHELKFMRQEFEQVIDERLGWVRADIASGRELSGPQREEIERALGSQLGKFIRADYKVDPALLAGIRARVASKEYDATLRGKLENMRQRLHAGF